MSSDVLSQGREFKNLIWSVAGAQKNIGLAGVNVIVVNKKILGKDDRKLPTMMDYRNHIEAGLPCSIRHQYFRYMFACLPLSGEEQGGVAAMRKKLMTRKAKIALRYIDVVPLLKNSWQGRQQQNERMFP